MKRMLLALALAAAVIPGGAGATERPGYAIDFPAGWRVADPDAEGMTVARNPASRANCNSYYKDIPAFASWSQADLNAELTRPWGQADWVNISGMPADKLVVEGSHVTAIGPYQLRLGELRMRPGTRPGQAEDVLAYIGVTLVPGRLIYAGCYGNQADYAASRAVIEAAVESLRPR